MAAVPAPTLITNSMDRSHDPLALVNAPTLYFTVFLVQFTTTKSFKHGFQCHHRLFGKGRQSNILALEH
jgi:hypothetical protein